MAHKDNIREGSQVLGSDGGMVGRVKGLHGDHIHVEPTVPSHSGDHTIPLGWVVRADDHVHLDRDAALVRDTWGSGHPIPPAQGATSARTTTTRTAETHHAAAHKGMGKSWMVWLIGALLLLLIIVIGIRGFGYAADDSSTEQPAVNAPDA